LHAAKHVVYGAGFEIDCTTWDLLLEQPVVQMSPESSHVEKSTSQAFAGATGRISK
jgi:hypothetical protein